MNRYTFAVVGALGNVGTEMRNILAASDLPISKLVLMDIPENAGKTIEWKGDMLTVVAAEPAAFSGVDIALFSAGAEASKILAPEAVKHGCIVVDNSTAFRMDPDCPLVIPEVNSEALEDHGGIIANPNCSTIQMLAAAGVTRIQGILNGTTNYILGEMVEELEGQVRAFADGTDGSVAVYPHQIAFNALPHIDVFLDNGYTKEEMKMIVETHKILDPNIQVTATTVRMPVVNGHSESINIETEKPFEVEDIKQLMAASKGIVLEDDPQNNVYPMAINASGKDPVYVGRIRRDFSTDSALNMWCVSDNLRKGAALNTIQIADELIKRDLVKL